MIRRPLPFALLIVTTAVHLAAMPEAAPQSWPSFRGADGTGRALQGLPPGEGPLSLKLRWKRVLGTGYSGVSVAEGVLVTVFAEGGREVIIALDATSGEERWRHELAPVYVGHDGSYYGSIATPAIADGRVFVLGSWGHLAALDLQTGAALWATHLVDDLGSEKPHYGFGGSPVVVGDTLVLPIGGQDGAVAGFDVTSGELRWRSVEDEIFAQSPIVTELAGRRQVVVMAAKTLVGLDPTDGTILWTFAHGGGEPNMMGSLTQSALPVGNDRIFIKQSNSSTALVEVKAGEAGMTATVVQETRGLHRSYSPPTLWGDQAYGYTNRLLSALDLDTGELLWRSRDPGDGFLVALDGQLAVLTKEGSLHIGEASPEGWEEAASLQIFDDLAWTPPSFGDGGLYLRSQGEVARVDLVRTAPVSIDTKAILPPVLRTLVADVRAAGDPEAVVDRFLAGREVPLVDGEDVVFLWRGDAEDVAVAGEMIGMRREEKMERLEETDLWWWSTELDRRARINYLYFVDYGPRVDPSHDRRAPSTVLGPDMNWLQTPEPMGMSWFAMPEWPGREMAPPSAPEKRGRVEEFELTVTPLRPADVEPRPAALSAWLPPGYDEGDKRYPVVFVHNPFARSVGDWVETLDRVVGRSVEPLIVVFVEIHVLPGYPRVFADQIAPGIDARYRTRTDREARANVGMGWYAPDAIMITFGNPERFGLLGLQSHYALTVHMTEVEESLGDADADTVPMRIYLEWGRWDLQSPHEELDFRVSSRQTWELLRERGYDPIGGEVWDSTDFGSWRNRTDLLLESLFPLDATKDPAGFARWATGDP